MSQPSETPNSSSQWSLRATIFMITAIGVWLGFLLQLSGWRVQGIVVVTGFAVTVGAMGHLAYEFVARTRATVVVVSLLIYLVAAYLIFAFASSLSLKDAAVFLVENLTSPVRGLVVPRRGPSRLSVLFALLITLAFTPAHSIRPSLPTAFVTSFGVGAWIATGLLFSISRFFGA